MDSRCKALAILASLAVAPSAFAADLDPEPPELTWPVTTQFGPETGFYLSAKLVYALLRMRNMDTSLRPGIGSFVAGDQTDESFAGSLATGFQHANWRYELEYTFSQRSEFTSGSSAFPTSYNHHIVDVQRVMANLYRDFPLSERIALNLGVGLGVGIINAYGWQGVQSRRFDSNRQTNLTYSLGAGASYRVNERLYFDAGYRFVDMGSVESGYNTFSNARGLIDEQMRGRLISNEFFIGARFRF